MWADPAGKRTSGVFRRSGWKVQIGVLSVADLSFLTQDVPMHAFFARVTTQPRAPSCRLRFVRMTQWRSHEW